MTNHGARGSAFERKVKEQFEAAGWAVTRSAGSHGEADLWCVEPVDGNLMLGEIAYVQCKLGGPGRCAPAEWNRLLDFAMRYGGVPLIAHRPKRGRIEFLRIIGRKPDTGVRGPAAPVDEWRLGGA